MSENSMHSSPSGLIKYEGGKISVNVNSIPEAKIVIKELKLKKKEYTLAKKNIVDRQKAIRAEYTNEIRTRPPTVKGKGLIIGFLKTAQNSAKDNRRAQLAHDLEPLETKKQEVDRLLAGLESIILQVEAYILKEQSANNQ